MIQVDLGNIERSRIGGHGLSRSTFIKKCQKADDLVRQIFRQKSQPGYAFLNLPEEKDLVKKITEFAKDQQKNKWENIVVLGIGGSSLGTIALQEALLGPLHNLSGKPRLFVVDNVDPTYTAQLLKIINLKKSLFIVISKSGSTVEPMVLYSIVKERLEKEVGAGYNKHLVFITDPKKGLLRPIAKKEGITVFDVPPKIGGRFSVLTAVGLLPAALVGVNIKKLLKGAASMRDLIKKKKAEQNPALQLAMAQYLLDKKKGKEMTVLMPYSNHLFRMGDWYRQLLAESIGKSKRTGPTPINALGTTDQHSQLQLYAEGPNNKLIIFMRVMRHAEDPKVGNILPKEIGFLNGKKMSQVIDAAYMGTAESLAKNDRPNLTLTLNRINEELIGQLFMLLEFQVALLGLLYKVNTFNQPGVEQSKVLTKKILS